MLKNCASVQVNELHKKNGAIHFGLIHKFIIFILPGSSITTTSTYGGSWPTILKWMSPRFSPRIRDLIWWMRWTWLTVTAVQRWPSNPMCRCRQFCEITPRQILPSRYIFFPFKRINWFSFFKDMPNNVFGQNVSSPDLHVLRFPD